MLIDSSKMNEFCDIVTSKIKPALSYKSTNLTEPALMRINENDPVKPMTIIDLFNQTVSKSLEKPAMVYKDSNNSWITITYEEYRKKVIYFAKILIKLGLEPRTSIGILGDNSPEWIFAEMAAIFAGGVTAGIYQTNSTDAVHHVLSTSNATIALVDDIKQMEKIRACRHRLPSLKTIIQLNGPYDEFFEKEKGYYKWSDLQKLNIENDLELNRELQNRLENIVINECCMLIYTSGTCGFPKAVMLSHDTLIYVAKAAAVFHGDFDYENERTVSYLPLSHIAAQMFDVFMPLVMGGCVYFADRDALKGSLVKTLLKAQPTYFFGVPRVFEKIQEKMTAMEKNSYFISKVMIDWAKYHCLNHYLSIMKGNSSWISPTFWLADKIVHNVKVLFGLDKCRIILTGGAHTSTDTKKYFLGLNLKLLEIFGMSETSGGVCYGPVAIKNLDTIGTPIKGVEFKIDELDENGMGEICLKGRTNFMGYLNESKKTDETIGKGGWIKTGDVGYIDNEGFIYVIGRKKEIVITSGGENIPPIHIENLVKTELPGISNAFLIGDRRKYLTMLITIKTEISSISGLPLDHLQPDAIKWMNELDLKYTKISEIINAGPCPIVLKSIKDGIKAANLNSISKAQKVQKFTLLPNDFSVAGGELGPTLKNRREFIIKKYAEFIDKMYS